MTLTIRNNLLIFLFCLGALILCSSIFLAFLSLKQKPEIFFSTTQLWWLAHSYVPKSAFFTIIGLLILSCFSWLSSIILHFSLKKTTSNEIFCLIIFLLSLSLQAFRLGQPIILQLDLPSFLAGNITRLSYFGHLFSSLILVIITLFSLGTSRTYIGVLLGIDWLLSLFYVISLPVDTLVTTSNLLNDLTDEPGAFIIFAFLYCIPPINFLFAYLNKKNIDYLFLSLGMICLVVANSFLFFQGFFIATLVSFFVLCVGIWIIVNKIFNLEFYS